ncbi:inactive histone-lysine N-methyltransferase 2E-like isoform X4 [Branchiostoma floridae x Branchiostoma japonicum]
MNTPLEGVAPTNGTRDSMAAGSDPESVEAPVAPGDSNSCQQTTNQTTTTASSTAHHSYLGLPYQDHNYGAPPPPSPPPSPQAITRINGVVDENSSNTNVSSTVTADEDTCADDDAGITRCICNFDHDDGYMICCDKCSVWQHIDCMGISRDRIPETYLCERCEPRDVDRQRAVEIQTRKRIEMTDDDTSGTESGDEMLTYRAVSHTPTSVTITTKPTKKVKKRKREKSGEKDHEGRKKKVKTCRDPTRRASKPKVHRTPNGFNSLNNEDANEPWDYSPDDSDVYQEAISNQYTPDLASFLKTRQYTEEDVCITSSDQLQVESGEVASIGSAMKCVRALRDLHDNQPILEYRGKVMTRQEFQDPFFKRPHPHVLFYPVNGLEICVDARSFGNAARYIRRSCSPNAEVRHVLLEGMIHLCVYSLEEIMKGTEITIGFDYDFDTCPCEVECACQRESCPVAKSNARKQELLKQKRKRNKSGQQSGGDSESSTGRQRKVSPLRVSLNHNASTNHMTSDGEDESKDVDVETEEAAEERRRKMTREERKLEAVMRTFERMEKRAARSRAAHARIEKQKQTKVTPNENKEGEESMSKDMEDLPKQTATPHRQIRKRRRSQSRRNHAARGRQRLNSTCSSDMPMSPITETAANTEVVTTEIELKLSAPTTPVSALSPSIPSPSMAQELTVSTVSSVNVVPQPSPAALGKGFKFPKTKKFFVNEWLNEKANEQSAHKPLLIKTEPSDFSTGTTTCPSVSTYTRSTSMTARSPGPAYVLRPGHNVPASATKTRQRPSLDSSFGSAKKRWLRQAMSEGSSNGPSSGCNSPAPSGGSLSPGLTGMNGPDSPQCVSPTGSISSLSGKETGGELMTPLKKRRLRVSISGEGSMSPMPMTPPPSAGETDCAAKQGPRPKIVINDAMRNGFKPLYSPVTPVTPGTPQFENISSPENSPAHDHDLNNDSNPPQYYAFQVVLSKQASVDSLSSLASSVTSASGMDRLQKSGSETSLLRARMSSLDLKHEGRESCVHGDSSRDLMPREEEKEVEENSTAISEYSEPANIPMECDPSGRERTDLSSSLSESQVSMQTLQNSCSSLNDSHASSLSLSGSLYQRTLSERLDTRTDSQRDGDPRPRYSSPFKKEMASPEFHRSLSDGTLLQDERKPEYESRPGQRSSDLEATRSMNCYGEPKVVANEERTIPSGGDFLRQDSVSLSSSLPSLYAGRSEEHIGSAPTTPVSLGPGPVVHEDGGSKPIAKRKVSLLEYRKRKQQGQKDGNSSANSSAASTPTKLAPDSSPSTPIKNPMMSPLSTMPSYEHTVEAECKDKEKDRKAVDDLDKRWSTPTSVERIREEDPLQRFRRELKQSTERGMEKKDKDRKEKEPGHVYSRSVSVDSSHSPVRSHSPAPPPPPPSNRTPPPPPPPIKNGPDARYNHDKLSEGETKDPRSYVKSPVASSPVQAGASPSLSRYNPRQEFRSPSAQQQQPQPIPTTYPAQPRSSSYNPPAAGTPGYQEQPPAPPQQQQQQPQQQQSYYSRPPPQQYHATSAPSGTTYPPAPQQTYTSYQQQYPSQYQQPQTYPQYSAQAQSAQGSQYYTQQAYSGEYHQQQATPSGAYGHNPIGTAPTPPPPRPPYPQSYSASSSYYRQ